MVPVLLRVAGLVASLVAAWPGSAHAARYGLFIGSNHGLPEEPTLLYAESDAAKVREILVQHGGFAAENATVLDQGDAQAVQRALISINERIRTSGTDTNSMLFVYYSGHADQEALHLGESKLPLDVLKSLVRGSAARFRLLVLDACRSGTLTRVKGAAPTSPFDISIVDSLSSEGLALITSSSANEASQEADDIRGSFFTHFFTSGLLGPADYSGDLRVSVEEAYAYAYRGTIAATSRTLGGTQHPTFDYDIRGHGSVELTDLTRGDSRTGILFVPVKGNVLILRASDGDAVLEIQGHDASDRVLLPAGDYLVRVRRTDHYLEGRVTVVAERDARVNEDDLSRLEYARLVRKGIGDATQSHAILATAGWHSEALDGLGGTPDFGLTYLLELRHVSLGLRASYAFGRARNDVLRTSLQMGQVEAVGRLSLDLPGCVAWAGLGAGLVVTHETYRPRALASQRTASGAVLSAEGGVLTDVFSGWLAGIDLGLRTYVMRVGLRDRVTGLPAFVASMAVGRQL